VVKPSAPPEANVKLFAGGAPVRFTLQSCGFGGTKGVSSKVDKHEFTITKKMDGASAKLFRYCTTGKHIPTVVITARKKSNVGGQQKYLVITLNQVLISADQTGANSGGAKPTETLSLNFTKVEFTYRK